MLLGNDHYHGNSMTVDYQRCVLTCESVAVVHRRPFDNTCHVAALKAGTKAK